VDGLQAKYGEQIAFYHVDIDERAQTEISRPFGVWRRSQYVLLDPEGNVLQEWNGYLQQEEVSHVLEAALAQHPLPE
jgi:thioredoxin-related protein